MSDEAQSLLTRGIAAAKANDRQEARFYLEWVLRLDDAEPAQKADAYLWLSQTTDDPAERRDHLEYVLAIDPSNALARRGLAVLDGKLKPEDQIDHRQPVPPSQPAAAPAGAKVRRYICPRCAGQMTFEPKRRALTCGYCGHRLWEHEALQQGALAREQDFAAVLPTARAQRWELPAERTLNCQGCGATFTVPPGRVAGACPFCGSAHVIMAQTGDELIQPDSIVPFQFDQAHAHQCVRAWLDKQRFRPDDLDETAALDATRGVYLPYWTFDVGGEVKWRCLVQEGSGRDARWVPRSDSYLVYHNDLVVPASHSLPPGLLGRLIDFDLTALTPYTPDALAGWTAEVYQIAMADASLVARRHAVQEGKRHITQRTLAGTSVRDLAISSAGIVIESFRLTLLPVWLSGYRYKKRHFPLAVNGQSGAVAGDVPRGGFQKLLAGLFGED